MFRTHEHEVTERFRFAGVERSCWQLQTGADGGHGFVVVADSDESRLGPDIRGGGLLRADHGGEELVGHAGKFHGLVAVAFDDRLRGTEHPTFEFRAILEVHAAIGAPEEAGLLADFSLIEWRRFAEEEAPLAQIERGGGGVFEFEFEIEQVR